MFLYEFSRPRRISNTGMFLINLIVSMYYLPYMARDTATIDSSFYVVGSPNLSKNALLRSLAPCSSLSNEMTSMYAFLTS